MVQEKKKSVIATIENVWTGKKESDAVRDLKKGRGSIKRVTPEFKDKSRCMSHVCRIKSHTYDDSCTEIDVTIFIT
jgi:hypothetical protein